MPWVVRATVDDAAVDRVAADLWTAGTSGVAEIPGPDGSVEIIAGFDERAAAARAAAALNGEIQEIDELGFPAPPPSTVEVGGVALEIDAAHTFGHGRHPTTRLCLDLLVAALMARPGSTVLDVGTGSGVLAIAAARLGAVAMGVDLDEAILEVARSNAGGNLAPGMLPEFRTGSVADLPRHDIVVANMLITDLEALDRPLADLAAHRLIVSGVLPDQIDRALAAVAPTVRSVERHDLDGWVALDIDPGHGHS